MRLLTERDKKNIHILSTPMDQLSCAAVIKGSNSVGVSMLGDEAKQTILPLDTHNGLEWWCGGKNTPNIPLTTTVTKSDLPPFGKWSWYVRRMEKEIVC
jgi:hypothetical protein